jgi:hypothetical protein
MRCTQRHSGPALRSCAGRAGWYARCFDPQRCCAVAMLGLRCDPALRARLTQIMFRSGRAGAPARPDVTFRSGRAARTTPATTRPDAHRVSIRRWRGCAVHFVSIRRNVRSLGPPSFRSDALGALDSVGCFDPQRCAHCLRRFDPALAGIKPARFAQLRTAHLPAASTARSSLPG